MTVTEDVLTGVANLIATAGFGVWNPAGTYALTDTGIFLKTMPDGAGIPDRVITLNLVPVTANISFPYGTWFLQVACRGNRNDPLDVDRVADPVFDILHGLTNRMFGATHLTQLFFHTGSPMGQDANTRWERADKYLAGIDSPATILRPTGGSWD